MPHLNGKTARTEFLFIREFNAPLQYVFNAWTDEKQIAKWWGPYGFTNPVCKWNAHENGDIYIDMTAPDGMVFPMRGTVHEVSFPAKLVFTSKAFEEEGVPQLEVLNTAIFCEENGRTILHLKAVIKKASHEVEISLQGMEEGWSQSLDKLENLLN